MDIVSFVSQSILTASANLFVFLFCRNIFGCRYSRKILYAAAYLLAVILMIGVNQLKNPYINMVYSFVSANAISMVMFNAKLKNAWLHNLLFWIIFIFCDMVTVIIWSVIEGKTLQGILSDYQLMIGSNMLNIIFMYISYRVYITIMQRHTVKAIRLKLSIFMIAMTAFEVFIVVSYASQITDRQGGIRILIILFGYLVMNIIFAYILNQLADAYRDKYELSLSERLCEMYLANYNEISQKYEESRAIIHDIKKHLMVVDNIKDSDKAASESYLSDICQKMSSLFCGFQCSNKILSIVLSQKISYAKSKGIEVSVSADDVDINFIDDLDITAIFANLWDNAIEACEKIGDDSKKTICMDIRRINDFILVNISNSYNGELLKNSEDYLSTKKDHDGVGLKSIALSVEKYDGVFTTKHSIDTFKAEITLPIQ